jgi:hypothetical protein
VHVRNLKARRQSSEIDLLIGRKMLLENSGYEVLGGDRGVMKG